MKWRKLGRIFDPTDGDNWFSSHASTPFAVHFKEDIYRIFFSSRDVQNRSHIGFVDIDFAGDFTTVGASKEPLLSPGSPGLFDDSGCSMGCVHKIQNQYYLYYMGWNLKVTVPWQNTVGLAISESLEGPFIKKDEVPVLDRNINDPFSISYPFIRKENDQWAMYYGSNLSWGKEQSSMKHVIKKAASLDGINWNPSPDTIIGLEPGEIGLSRPTIIELNSSLHMWYSIRTDTGYKYRIGYAHSDDGKSWERKDQDVGISTSSSGFDDEMICYAHVFQHKEEIFMVYNGNDFGRTGFGIATLEHHHA